MDSRLYTIASQIDNGIGFIDVGTDHGYLPIHMAENDYSGYIFASDINEAPLNNAISSAKKVGLGNRIIYIKCDGLALCPKNKIDTIIIAGMGGDNICKILDEAEWCLDSKYKLILQPMTKAEVLRYWLINNGFEIHKELLTSQYGALYQTVVTRFGGESKLTLVELFCGSFENADNKQLYLEQLDRLYNRFNKSANGISRSDSVPPYRAELFQSILKQLEQMRDKYDQNY